MPVRPPCLILMLACAATWLTGGEASPAGSGPATAVVASGTAVTRQARQLIRQAEEQLAMREPDAAAAIYEQVLERAVGTPAEFTAQLGLGRIRFAAGTFDEALERFQRASARGAGIQAEPNPDLSERAEALYHVGLCHIRLGQNDRCFPSLRAVTEVAPGTAWANRAFFEIGEAHLQAGSFTQAIANFRMVGASLDQAQSSSLRVDLGRPLVLQVVDLDFLTLKEPRITVDVISSTGDKEQVTLLPQVPGSERFVGQISTAPGAARPGDGVLQAIGTSTASMVLRDHHTAAGTLDVERSLKLVMAADGQATITDGAFRDPVVQLALDQGKGLVNLRVRDADRDVADTAERIDAELVAEQVLPPEDSAAIGEAALPRYQLRSKLAVQLVELAVSPDALAPTKAAAAGGVHSGVFALTVPMVVLGEGAAAPAGALVVALGDRVTLRYRDERHLIGDDPRERLAHAAIVPGDSANLSVAGTNLPDAELRVRRDLLLAETSMRLGAVYRDMGLEKYAQERFAEALTACQRVIAERGVIDNQLRASTLHTLWSIYLAKGELENAASACRALQAEFPTSDLIDDSLLALGAAAQAAGNEDQAVRVFEQIAALPKGSPLAAEAIWRIGQMHEARALKYENANERGRAIVAYRRVFTGYPDSSFAAESLRKIGDFYFADRNFVQAIDFFERTLREHPDAPFVADVLFNLGRSRYLKVDYPGALQVVDRIQREFPTYERMDKVRALRQFIQQKLGGGK